MPFPISPVDTYTTYATPHLLVNTWVLEVECHHLYSALPHVHGRVVGRVEPRTTRIGPHQVLLCASQHLCRRGERGKERGMGRGREGEGEGKGLSESEE